MFFVCVQENKVHEPNNKTERHQVTNISPPDALDKIQARQEIFHLDIQKQGT